MTRIRNTHMLTQGAPKQIEQLHQAISGATGGVAHSRRNFMKWAAVGALAVFAAPALPAFAASGLPVVFESNAAKQGAKNVLIVYFSHSGHTRQVAGQIHQRVGGDVVELKAVTGYPREYNAVVEQAKQEQKADARPQIAIEIANIGSYDTVFIGYPNWWGTMPMPLFTLLEQYDFSEKKIIPFCTHEGSGLGRSASDIKKLYPGANVLEGLAVHGSRVAGAQEAVDSWLKRLGFGLAQ